METIFLIGIAVITAIALLYVILLKARINNYSNRSDMFGLFDDFYRATIIVGLIVQGALIFYTQGNLLMNEFTVIALHSYLFAVLASACFILMRRQLYMRSLRTIKKFLPGVYVLAVAMVFSFLGLCLLTWQVMDMDMFEYAYSQYVATIAMCFVLFFIAINTLAAARREFIEMMKKIAEDIRKQAE
ncbi:MAG: hypothetical protein Q8Q67_01700 [bacterium]|nr:hypothetical protein [bacterium]